MCYIACVAGSSKATQVFSSAKYPTVDQDSDDCSLFTEIHSIRSQHPVPDDKVLDDYYFTLVPICFVGVVWAVAGSPACKKMHQ